MISLRCPSCDSGLWIGKPLDRLCLPCGTRTTSPGGTAGKRMAEARRPLRMSPDQKRARTHRDYLRRQARDEARETGQPVDEILAAWRAA